MANYLERVASSAGRRAAVAKPPASGPPVLPAGRDFPITPVDPFASDEEQFVDATETFAPARTEARTEVPSTPKVEAESETRTTRDETLAAPVHPEPKPHTSVERLSSEAPFTVHLPRTLRPSVAARVPPAPDDDLPRVRPPVRASTTLGPEEFKIGDTPTPIPKVQEPVTAKADTTTPTPPAQPLAAGPVEEHQAPVPIHTESTLPVSTPIPRVDRVDGPAKQSAEPSPPPALPVHLPPAVSNSAGQDQSRIHIGSLEVLVNNHPRVTTVRPATAPSRTERLNLEKRYLDRFRLRH